MTNALIIGLGILIFIIGIIWVAWERLSREEGATQDYFAVRPGHLTMLGGLILLVLGAFVL